VQRRRIGIFAGAVAGAAFLGTGSMQAATTGFCDHVVETTLINNTASELHLSVKHSSSISAASYIPTKIGPADGQSMANNFVTPSERNWALAYDDLSKGDEQIEISWTAADGNKYNALLHYWRGNDSRWVGDPVAIGSSIYKYATSFSKPDPASITLSTIDLFKKVSDSVKVSLGAYLNVEKGGATENGTSVGDKVLKDTTAMNVLKVGNKMAVAVVGVPSDCPAAGWVVTVMTYDAFNASDLAKQ
jgi:hypothetical protein